MAEQERPERKRGRVEAALEAEFLERRDIHKAERAALRVQAHAVDVAEAMSDPDVMSRANECYLRLRAAAGLTSGGVRPVDAFDDIMARLAAPSADLSHTAND